jgi:hypothetical protein
MSGVAADRLVDLTRNKPDAFPNWVAPLRLEPAHVARTDMKLNAHRELKVINLEDSGSCCILFDLRRAALNQLETPVARLLSINAAVHIICDSSN